MKQGIFVVLFFVIPLISLSQTAEDFYNNGNNCVQNQDYTGAIVSYTKSINKNAQFIDSYFNRALAKEKLYDTRGA
ncbi:MAG TPA: tetratricopeptide repeat protein, partial [Bacteroidales bacterium]|nr:tetratricopeptide repeat protein [Bacteroidales bacterium]